VEFQGFNVIGITVTSPSDFDVLEKV